MRFQAVLLTGLLLFLGCGSTFTPGNSPRSYSATASVGDFLSITLDPAAHTLAYTNVSNGDTGTIPYTVNVDDVGDSFRIAIGDVGVSQRMRGGVERDTQEVAHRSGCTVGARRIPRSGG